MRWLGLLALALLVACKSEPSFDERYEAAERTIRDKAEAIDSELEERSEEVGGNKRPVRQVRQTR